LSIATDTVITGLVPVISIRRALPFDNEATRSLGLTPCPHSRDDRDKPGHDVVGETKDL
jgi:hypothetical protein